MNELPQRDERLSMTESVAGGVPDPSAWRKLVHDIDNAISVVTINVAMLRDDAPDSDPETEMLVDIEDAARRVSMLSTQLRSLLIEAMPESSD